MLNSLTNNAALVVSWMISVTKNTFDIFGRGLLLTILRRVIFGALDALWQPPTVRFRVYILLVIGTLRDFSFKPWRFEYYPIV